MTNAIKKCPIWGTNAEGFYFPEYSYFRVISSRAGGVYRMDEFAIYHLNDMYSEDLDVKIKMTDWIIERQFDELNDIPLITQNVIDEIIVPRRLKNTLEQCHDLLKRLIVECPKIGDRVSFWCDDDHASTDLSNRLMAHSHCTNGRDLFFLLCDLYDKGWIRPGSANGLESVGYPVEVLITTDGREYSAGLTKN